MRKAILCVAIFMIVCCEMVCYSQSCPIDTLGQNPSTAFPVCGTNSFIQKQVNLCGGKGIPNPKCNTYQLLDVNPYWYKFTCFEAGTLGFTIQPNSPTSDYDWQVFDITGVNVGDVYTNPALTICSNWSEVFGNTGTTTTAANLLECEGPTPQFSKMPALIKGHQYLLLVSHFTNTQAGYKLVFNGGTASITDTTAPHLQKLYEKCDGERMSIKLNKKMKCSSLSANGSEFILLPNVAKVISATAPGCATGFDMDSLVLKLDKPIPPGKYTIKIKPGSDGNTILDICDNSIPVTDSLTFTVLPAQPTPMDSVNPVACKPSVFTLTFKDPILCSSIAADGSDFSVTGPSAVTVKAAAGNCTSGYTNTIDVKLSGPVLTGGKYSITLKKGTDGNTLQNECSLETPAGSFLFITCYDTVSAAINYNISSSCLADTLRVSNAGKISVNKWKWIFDDGEPTTQFVQRIYTSGIKTIRLQVSNGVCTDSSSVTINFDKNRLNAAFDAPRFVCPLDTAFFVDKSGGPVASWRWDFGNGNTSNQQLPPYQFYPSGISLLQYTATLTITAANNCVDTAIRVITVPGNCYIAVPSAFTPNGDGLNDYLYPLNAYKAINLDFKVYNRYGQLIWETNDWTKKWDGRINGELQASGVYVWHLVYTDAEKLKKLDLRGTTTLIR
jgi:gliding motility-associated-like protein